MGEARQKQEELNARAQEAAKAQEEFSKMLKTPMTQAEAEDALSRIDMQRAQLGVLRVQILEQLNRVDTGLAQAEYDRSIVLHRALIGRSGEQPAEGTPGEGEAARG